jgi:predicted enzyme related to lactoylglutathione lyase
MHGQFTWYELTTTDVDAAIRFYPRFTGWATQEFDANYTMWTADGVPFAGLSELTDEMRANGTPPNWLPYIESDDVDATCVRATSLGGTVVFGPADIPDVGRYAVIQDPFGAAFGVYKSIRGPGGWDGTPVIGRMSWHELVTTDHVAALAFYSGLFGWKKIGEMDMGGGDMYVMYGHGSTMYGGMFSMGSEMAGMHPFWLCYIHVKDVGKAVDIATRGGATVHRPQMDIPGGSIAILGDPQGAGFAVHHASGVAAATANVKKAARQSVARAAEIAKGAANVVSKRVAKATKMARKAAKAVSKKVAAKRKAVAKKKPASRPKAKAAGPRKAAARPAAKTKTKTRSKSKTKTRTKAKGRARRAPAAARRNGKRTARKAKRARR